MYFHPACGHTCLGCRGAFSAHHACGDCATGPLTMKAAGYSPAVTVTEHGLDTGFQLCAAAGRAIDVERRIALKHAAMEQPTCDRETFKRLCVQFGADASLMLGALEGNIRGSYEAPDMLQLANGLALRLDDPYARELLTNTTNAVLSRPR